MIVINQFHVLFFIITAYFIDQCERDDPELNACFMRSANKLTKYLQRGLPELDMEEVNRSL